MKTVMCRMEDGSFREYRATWLKGGIAVHGSPIGGYAITHAPTGYAFIRGRLEPQHAVILANRILPLADWETLTRDQMLEPGLYHDVWAVISGGLERGSNGVTPEEYRLAMYASDFDEAVIRRLSPHFDD